VVEVGPDLKLLRDYVAGRLPEPERLELETRMEQDPTLAQELEQLLRFREGLQMLVNRGYYRGSGLRRTRRLAAWMPFVAAAGVAAVALVLWQWHLNDAGSVLTARKDTGGALVPIAQHLKFVVTRGSAPAEEVLPSGGLIEFRIQPERAVPGEHFRVTLIRTGEQSAETVGTIAGLPVAADQYVYAYADASRLSAGSYLLKLDPAPGSHALSESFPLRLHTQ
jgi:hypothetical protein